MTARVKIDQAGLGAGVAGKARTDGLDTGALVTLEDVSGTGASSFHLLWTPVEDIDAEASLAATGDPDVWTFTPTAGVYGSYLIELRDDGVPVERRIFGIRTPANQLLIPAYGERADRHASLEHDGADEIDACNQNADDFPLSALNGRRWAGWWRSLYELYRIVEFGLGSIADNAIALIKIAQQPAKTVLANATSATGNVTALAGSAAFQYLRVNSANNGLEMATLSGHATTSLIYDGATNTFQRAALTGAVTSLQNSNVTAFGSAAAKSVLANATNGSAVPAFLAGSAAFQYLRVNSANNALEMATLSSHASTSLIYDGATNTFQLAAATGAVTRSQNSNTFAFGSAAARSILLNATNGSAVPAFLAGSVPRNFVKVNAAGNGLEWTGAADGVLTASSTTTNSTAVVTTTGSYTIPANTLQVGSRFRCEFTYQFVRGATATALNLLNAFEMNTGGTGISLNIAAKTAAGTYNVRVVGEFTVTSIGAGGSCMATMTVFGTAESGAVPVINDVSNAALALNTTVANSPRGAAQMNVAVANCSIILTGGHIQQMN